MLSYKYWKEVFIKRCFSCSWHFYQTLKGSSFLQAGYFCYADILDRSDFVLLRRRIMKRANAGTNKFWTFITVFKINYVDIIFFVVSVNGIFLFKNNKVFFITYVLVWCYVCFFHIFTVVIFYSKLYSSVGEL